MTYETCSIAATLDLVGDRWTLLILRDLFRGMNRFDDVQKDLGIARNLLSNRLQKLVENDIVTRLPYQERPTRYEYRLTPKGQDLSPSLIALMQWGDRWCASEGPPILLFHESCGTELTHSIFCQNCEIDVKASKIRSRPGPGIKLNQLEVH
tara:strand:- start:224 stop:679 length:456 start_codon:yes stop_codon:yes gene_type:complete